MGEERGREGKGKVSLKSVPVEPAGQQRQVSARVPAVAKDGPETIGTTLTNYPMWAPGAVFFC